MNRMGNWERFNKKYDDYDQYRPRYPLELLILLGREAGLGPDSYVADIGSGTGLLAELLLESNCGVVCIEPNDEMRKVAQEKLGKNGRCKILDGTAERTSLQASSVDFITVGQAFHWFDPKKTRDEFSRILRPNGKVVLVWNTRVEQGKGINVDYERIVRMYSNDYHASGGGSTSTGAFADFFDEGFKTFKLRNDQRVTYEGLVGRYRSASYAIEDSDPRFEAMVKDFEDAFERNEDNGYVTIEYQTEVFIGSVGI